MAEPEPKPYEGDGWWCDVCEVECNAQDSYDAHMAGKKHGKMVVAQNCLKRLRKTQTCFRYDEETGAYWCLICNLEVTSPQVLEQHFKSAKHKGEAEKIKGGGSVPSHKSSSPPHWNQKNNWSPPGGGRRFSPPPRGRGRSPSPARKRSRSPSGPWGTRKQSPVGNHRYRSRSPHRSPRRSPQRSPRRSPRRNSPRRSRSPAYRRQRSRSRDRFIGNGNDRRGPGFDSHRPPLDDRKLSDFRQAESRLITRHKKIQEDLERNPESHPLYDIEWKKFWERRFREIERQGGDPNRYDYNTEWIAYWMQKMLALADLDMERERRELLENFNMDDPGPPPPKLPPVTYPGFGPTPIPSEKPKENPTSYSGWSVSPNKNEDRNMFPSTQAHGDKRQVHEDRGPQVREDRGPQARGDRGPQARGDRGPQARGDRGPQARGDRGPQARGDRGPQARGDRGPQARGDRGPQARGDRRPQPHGDRTSGGSRSKRDNVSAHQNSRPSNKGLNTEDKEYTVVGTLKMFRDLHRDFGQLGTFGPAINCLLVKSVDMIEKGEDAMDLFRDEDSKMMIRLATDKLASQLSSNTYGSSQISRTKLTIERGRWLQNAGNDMFGLDIDVIARATVGLSSMQVVQSVGKALTNAGKTPDENNLKRVLDAVITIHGKLLSQAPSFPSGNSSSALFPSGAAPVNQKESLSREDSPAPGSGALSLLMSSYDEGAMSLLKSYDDETEEQEPNVLGDLQKKSLTEITELLSNFSSLKKDDQKELTAFLKKLEITDSNKVTRIREMVRAKAKANAMNKSTTSSTSSKKTPGSANASNPSSSIKNPASNMYNKSLEKGFSMNNSAPSASWSLR